MICSIMDLAIYCIGGKYYTFVVGYTAIINTIMSDSFYYRLKFLNLRRGIILLWSGYVDQLTVSKHRVGFDFFSRNKKCLYLDIVQFGRMRALGA